MRAANLKNLIAAWILSLLIICTAWGDIIVVNPGESIQTAIDSASYGDTVEVSAGTYIERITLKNGVAVIGAGDDVTIIDGDDGGSVVTCNGCDANTVLEGFTITDGRAANGGGMYNVNGSPTINNCTFSGNTTDNGDAGVAGMPGDNAGHGGGMYNDNSSPFVSNCTFQGNTTGAGGAGGDAAVASMPGLVGGNGGNGAGIYNTNNSSAILINCIFSGNAAGAGGDGGTGGNAAAPMVPGGNGGSGGDGGKGGGVYNDNSTATMINCIFNSNSAGMGGNGGNGGDAHPDNPGQGGYGGDGGDGGDGGGVENYICWPVVTNCTFYGNSCGEGGMGGAGGTGNPAGGNGAAGYSGVGGGMYNEALPPKVTNCILWGDEPDEIYNSGTSPTVTYSDVEGGTGQSWFGTGCIDKDPCFVDAAGGDFHLLFGSPCIDAGTNSAPSLPATDFEGDIRIINGVVDMGIDECIFGLATSPSPADGATMVSLDAQLSWTAGVGALSHDVWFGTDNPPTTLIADDITDTNTDPGVLQCMVTYYWRVDENTEYETIRGDVWSFRTEIREIWVDDNYWDGGVNDGHTWGIDAFDNIGAAIDRSEYGTTVYVAGGRYVERITLKNGVALIGAGAGSTVIDAGGSGRVVYSSGCDANTILEGFAIIGGNTYDGGGMYNYQSRPTVTNCKFSGNDATYDGGGMYNMESSPTVTNCTFSGNIASSPIVAGGGGMCNISSSPIVTNCTFTANIASSDEEEAEGGGMYNSNSSPTVTDCTFSGNIASCELGEAFGGGMYNYSSSPTVTNCTFSGNTADKVGGGMYNMRCSPTVTNCTFSANRAEYGGGMYNYDNSSPTVTNCTFSGNSASNGGGMVNDSSNPKVTDCTFTANIASSDEEEADGGGMYNSNSSPTVTNCTFSGNWADDSGGGMLNKLSMPKVTNCTFSGNSANQGGGMFNNDSNPIITNCILWVNTATTDPQIYGGATVSYSDVQSGFPGTGNIDADPCFVNAAARNFRLKPDSPCIDAGNTTAIPFGINQDMGGNRRGLDDPASPDTGISFLGVTVDIGAYEFQPCRIPGDINCDGVVDFKDVAILCGNWLAGTEPEL